MTSLGELQKETVEDMAEDMERHDDMAEVMGIVNISLDACKKTLRTCWRTCLRTLLRT